MPKHHFISYSPVDGLDFALKLADELQSGPPSIPVWLDRRELTPGRDWDESIVEALRTCDGLLFLMTPDSVDPNSMCKREWVRAGKYKKPIVPILLDREAEMPFQLEPRQYIDFADQSRFDSALAQLRKHLMWLASPAGELQTLKDRLSDAVRTKVREPDPLKRARIEDEIAQLNQQISEKQRIIDNPQSAAQRIEQSIASGVERERQPERPLSGITHSKFINPPPVAAPKYFQDRSLETKLIGDFLKDDSQRMNIVVGRGGIGKTAMVCRLLKSLERGVLPDDGGDLIVDGIVYLTAIGSHRVNVATIFADLAGLLPDDVASHIEETYKNPHRSLEERMRVLLEAFPSGRTVLLLDNFEDVVDSATQCIRDPELEEALRILLRLPHHGLKVIITTRIAPHDIMSVEAGRQLLTRLDEGLPSPYAENILREMDADGKLGLKSAPAELLSEARERTRGYPRALEALVSILRSDPATSLREILNDTEKLPPHNVVWGLVGEAFSRLDPVAQQAVQALAIYGRPVTPTAVNYLLQPYWSGVDSTAVLKRLVNIQFSHKEGDRYYLHPIDRAYALTRVEKGEVGDRYAADENRFTQYALLNRAADYFQQLRMPRQNWKSIADLAPQLAEFDLRCEGQDYDTASSILSEIGLNYVVIWGHHRLAVEMSERVLEKIHEPLLKSRCLNVRGAAYDRMGDCRKAIAAYEEALRISRDSFDLGGELAYLNNLSVSYNSIGQTERAIEFSEDALKIIRMIGDRKGEGSVLGNLGISYQTLGHTELAQDYHERSLRIAQDLGDRYLMEGESHNLAACYAANGRINDAIELYKHAVDINKAETFDRSWEANHYAGLGSCYLELGQFARAENCYEQDLEIRREIVDRSGEVSALMGLASCYRSMGRTSNAMELYEQALSISREIERSSEEVRIVGNLGSCYSNLGQVEQAINYYQQALDDARKIKRPKLEGLQLRNFADLFSYEGRYVEAIQFALKSQNIGEDLSSPYAGSHSNTYLAQAYLFSGDLNAARSAIEAAQQFDIPSNNYKVSALMGIIALRQGDKLKAQESFESTLQQIQVRLGHCADNYYALDIKGLVLCGLSLCTSTNQLVLAADTFKLARGINKEVGVVKRILCLFDALAHNSEDALAEVRTIAAAH